MATDTILRRAGSVVQPHHLNTLGPMTAMQQVIGQAPRVPFSTHFPQWYSGRANLKLIRQLAGRGAEGQ